MQRQLVVSLILIVVLLGVGIGVSELLIWKQSEAPAREPEQRALAVQAVRLEPRTVTEQILGYGTARADRHGWISTQVAGEVVELAEGLKIGAEVKEGQLLVHIDEREYREQLRRAESLLAADEAQLAALDVEEQNLERLIEIATSELEIARREYDRVRGLLEQEAAGRRELDLARAAYEMTRRVLQTHENAKALLPQRRAQQEATCELRRAEVALAKLNVERCSIVAPFGGRVEALQVELGEQAAPGNQLLALIDPSLIEVPIELPVSVHERVRIGAACTLSVDSVPDQAWTGWVKRIAPAASEATRTFELFAEVNNAEQERQLMPGFFVRAVVEGPTLEDVLLLPRGAVQQGRVYVYRDGKAYRREVHVQQHLLDQSVVTGVAAGEVIITSNLGILSDGAPVRVEGRAVAPGGRAAARANSDAPTSQK